LRLGCAAALSASSELASATPSLSAGMAPPRQR
jgi:hypothetical protein